MTIDHPHAGTLTLDRDVLTVTGSDLRIMIYTTCPGRCPHGVGELLPARKLCHLGRVPGELRG